MKNATQNARKLLASIAAPVTPRVGASYEVTHRGSQVRVTVPPSACHGCGGDGCRACKFTGENLPA